MDQFDENDEVDVEDKAISHLLQSINQLDPENEIDQQIIARVTKKAPQKKSKDGRQMMFSAQEVRQDMDLLRNLRNGLMQADSGRGAVSQMMQKGRLNLIEDNAHTSTNQSVEQVDRRYSD